MDSPLCITGTGAAIVQPTSCPGTTRAARGARREQLLYIHPDKNKTNSNTLHFPSLSLSLWQPQADPLIVHYYSQQQLHANKSLTSELNTGMIYMDIYVLQIFYMRSGADGSGWLRCFFKFGHFFLTEWNFSLI